MEEEEEAEEDWDKEPGGTDPKTRTPHKDVGNHICGSQMSMTILASSGTHHNTILPEIASGTPLNFPFSLGTFVLQT